MKLIGYWLTDLFDEQFMAPQELTQTMSEEMRETVAKYLDSGVRVAQYRGYSQCRFYCGVEYNGSSELSDGEWQWPEGLAHYVRVHGTLLPEEFVAKACRAEPFSLELKIYPGTSLEYWIAWCKQHRDPAFLTELARERREARARMARELEERVKALKRERGIRGAECAQANCGEQALADGAFCALHTVSETELELIRLDNGRKRPLLERWMAMHRT